MQRSDNIDLLATALAKAQLKFPAAVKDSVNSHFKNKFADLSAVIEVTREPLAVNGIAVIQPASADGDKVVVTTMLIHSSGQWISEDLTLKAARSDPQTIGGCITYGRRYGRASMLGISQEDDDGNIASQDSGAGSQTRSTSSSNEKYTGGPVNRKNLDIQLHDRGINEDLWNDIHVAMIGKFKSELDAVIQEVIKRI